MIESILYLAMCGIVVFFLAKSIKIHRAYRRDMEPVKQRKTELIVQYQAVTEQMHAQLHGIQYTHS